MDVPMGPFPHLNTTRSFVSSQRSTSRPRRDRDLDALVGCCRTRDHLVVQLSDVARCAEALEGVRCRRRDGLSEWRYHGRLVVRQLDATHVVIRSDFGFRDALLRDCPDTFSVPRRFAKHMMVVADLDVGDAEAIEDAIEAAWALQRSADAPT